jgi:hypothetical protein
MGKMLENGVLPKFTKIPKNAARTSRPLHTLTEKLLRAETLTNQMINKVKNQPAEEQY